MLNFFLLFLLIMPFRTHAMLNYIFGFKKSFENCEQKITPDTNENCEQKIILRINELIESKNLSTRYNLLVYLTQEINESWQKDIIFDNKITSFATLFHENNPENLSKVLGEFYDETLRINNFKKIGSWPDSKMFPFLSVTKETPNDDVRENLEPTYLSTSYSTKKPPVAVQEKNPQLELIEKINIDKNKESNEISKSPYETSSDEDENNTTKIIRIDWRQAP